MRHKLHQVAVFLRWSLVAVLVVPALGSNFFTLAAFLYLVGFFSDKGFRWTYWTSAALVALLACAAVTAMGFKAIGREKPLTAAAWLLLPTVLACPALVAVAGRP